MKIINNIFGRIILAALLALMAVMQPIWAGADSSQKLTLSKYAVFADRIVVSAKGAETFPSGTRFEVTVSGKKIKTVSASGAKKISIYDNGKYLKPATGYTIKVTAVNADGTKGVSASLKVTTLKNAYYSFPKGTAVYQLKGGKLSKKSTVSSKQCANGSLTDRSGKAIAGRSVTSCSGELVKLLSGEYKGCYVKADKVTRVQETEAKRSIVSAYGKAMNGGSYSYGAASFRRTDCSGLTMQCYAQIGTSLPHSVYSQATKGKSVSLNNMQPGDLIILNYRSHVAMYVGDGKMVHAMNSYDGIKVENISKLRYYHVDTVRRLIV